MIVQHAIGEPEFQRRMLEVLDRAAVAGQIPRWQWAYLYDRICAFEGRPQRYGTQMELDDEGCPALVETEKPASVNERRAEVGLDPVKEPERVPLDRRRTRVEMDEYRKGYHAWLEKVGWRLAK